MFNYTDADARRPIIVYIIVAIVLFAALILGIRWAKSRSVYYAQQQTGQSQPAGAASNQQTGTPTAQEPEQSKSTSAGNSAQTPSNAANSTSAVPSRVPSTGPEQVILPIISLSLVTFTATSYIRARRRLMSMSHAS